MSNATVTPVKFVAAAGSNFKDTDAQLLGPELARIARERENPTNETVVEEARDPRSPLHDYIFKLGDREAAEAHRLTVAGQVVRSILIEFQAGGKTHTKRAFEYIEFEMVRQDDEDDEPGEEVVASVRPRARVGRRHQKRRIVTAAFVEQNPDAESQVVENAKMQARMFKNKFEGYMATNAAFRQEFAEVFRALDRLFSKSPRKRKR